ncbi:leucine-rich repeat domain-containing protein [Flavobacterium sp. ASW18X]|uniref:leucine-rich repeat domain-containing protein n=1 Tax=Flavobacterium sp. ASW18X TaxID=2572595 RepID=UPI0010ADC0AA|nr:leucine-rich repeat domain-containing protein [Flavobacterium sp. ASW18X]TKD60480.1 hypothetical protein FBT53_12805 [Flavobacterium sp. ASW18X]
MNKTLYGKLMALCLVMFAFHANLSAQEEVSQREVIALLELRSRTNGHEWTHIWDTTKPIRTWYGVTVENGKVTGLDLSNNNLKGNLPLTIGNLTHLKVLDLSGNNLKGKIPAELRKFDDLRVVDLSGNNFSGKIPQTINRLQQLQEFNLADNQLTGALPKSLPELKNLRTLVLTKNKLNGKMPTGMEHLINLKELYLAYNDFEDLDNLKTLAEQQLVVTDIAIEGKSIKAINFNNASTGAATLKFSDME